jgi:GTP-binding protein
MADPQSDTAEYHEAGRRLFAQDCTFIFGTPDISVLPPPELPEIAFAGRSNVGKSSLINALTGRKNVARTSHTPGRTRELNFFRLGGRIVLVDLPGYGYAKASKSDIASWNETMRLYLSGRVNLSRLFLLIDGRHGLKPSDRDMMGLLDAAAVTYQLVLTKSDKVGGPALEDLVGRTKADLVKHAAAYPEIIATSSRTRSGLEDLRGEIAALAVAEGTG